ncbi:hypothetical protein [Rhodococcus sp. NPDC003348]
MLTHAGDRDTEAFLDEVASLVMPDGVHHGHYGCVVDWVVTALARVVVDKVDPLVDAGDLVIAVEVPDGRMVPVDRLPAPACHVWTGVVDVLTGHGDKVSADLAPLVYATAESGQARALIDAVAWLDQLLAMPSPEPDPDAAAG